MDKYRRVAKDKFANKETPEDEIRVTATGRTATYVTYAGKLFNEKELKELTIKATGTALSTAVTVAEIIKRRFKGLHQMTHLGSTEIVDEYEPLEEGLDRVTDIRQVSFIEITLSKNSLDMKDKGYQAPICDDLVKEVSPEEMARSRGRARRKGGKGKGEKGKGKGGKSKSKGKGGYAGKGGGYDEHYGKSHKAKGGKGYDSYKGSSKGKSKGFK